MAKVSRTQGRVLIMELTCKGYVRLFQRPHFHSHSTDQSQGILERIISAYWQVHMHQLLQDLSGCAKRFVNQ